MLERQRRNGTRKVLGARVGHLWHMAFGPPSRRLDEDAPGFVGDDFQYAWLGEEPTGTVGHNFELSSELGAHGSHVNEVSRPVSAASLLQAVQVASTIAS